MTGVAVFYEASMESEESFFTKTIKRTVKHIID